MPRQAKSVATRAANGSGTIRWVEKKGLWEGRITVGKDPVTGKQKTKSLYGHKQQDVRKKMTEAQAAVDAGTYLEPSRMTVGQWLETWLEEYNNSVKPSTKYRYKQDIKNHIVPALGEVKLSALTPYRCQVFCNRLTSEKGLSPKTVKGVHGVLHHALDRAARLGYIRSNPSDRLDLPKVEQAKVVPLDSPEVKALLDSLGEDVYSVAIRFDLFTGLREGELIGLLWSCVDFDRGEILIDKQLPRPYGKGAKHAFTSLKNSKSRVIQPAPEVMKVLKRWQTRQKEQRLAVGNLWDDWGFPGLVFTTETGKFLDYSNVRKHLKKKLEAAGLPDKRVHDLRHTFATISLQAGDDHKTLQENLGHATAAFTLDLYGHVTPTMRELSARRMEAFIADLKR